MKEEEIIQNNKLIAEFMGLVVVPAGTKTMGQIKHPEISEVFLYYHRSWDMLMPVVHHIQNFKKYRDGQKDLLYMSHLSVDISLSGYYDKCHTIITGNVTECHNQQIPHTYTKYDMKQISVTDKDPITATYIAVIQFIKYVHNIHSPL